MTRLSLLHTNSGKTNPNLPINTQIELIQSFLDSRNFSLLTLNAYANLPLLNLPPLLTTLTSSLNSFNTLFMTNSTFLFASTLSLFKAKISLLTTFTTFTTPPLISLSANGTPTLNLSLFTTTNLSLILNTYNN